MLSFINRADEGGVMDRVIAAQVYLRICELGRYPSPALLCH